ncbi:TPA: pheST operon leader peptide PheM [Escherichia coli]|nr:pheST operon leader peptide PheM [Escherichia coli]
MNAAIIRFFFYFST